tara:strand:+ start:488 stop:1909 length:1422 start_codon:yes stop_codon:yes gene_type:complete
MDLPSTLKSGEIARLFPVISETGKEQRASSIFLSVLSAVPQFAHAILSPLGQRIGARTQIDTYSEVVLKNDAASSKGNRPDGLIVLKTGQRVWTCLIEAKVGKSDLQSDQVERYLKLAKENGIDAVLTISNAFAAHPTHHPLAVQRNLLRKVDLYHLSWRGILIDAVLLHEQSEVKDPEQAFLLREFIRFFSHDSAGVTGFSSMPKEWSSAIDQVQAGGKITKVDGVEIVRAWHQQMRDLSLIMSRIISCKVGVKLSRTQINDPEKRLSEDLHTLCDRGYLAADLEIPDTASPLSVLADTNARSIRISMSVDAPRDRVRNASKVSWLLRQLKDLEIEDVYVTAIWASRAANTVLPLFDVRNDPKKIEGGATGSDIRAFEITLTSNSARRFSGVRTFIEELETLAPKFYENVGQHLESWQPSPPKPKHPITQSDDQEIKPAATKPAEEPKSLMAGNAHSDLLEIPNFLKRLSAL